MPTARVHRVASFGPEIMQALLRGAREPFEVGPIPYRKAVVFSQRVNKLRSAMRAEGHELAPLVSKARVRILWGERAGYAKVEEKFSSRNVPSPVDLESPAKLIIEPHDKEFSEVLIKSGIKAEDLKDDPLNGATPPAEPPLSDDYLDQVLNSKKLP